MSDSALLFRRARTALAPPAGAEERVRTAVRARVRPPAPPSIRVPRLVVAATIVGAIVYAGWPSAKPLDPSLSSPGSSVRVLPAEAPPNEAPVTPREDLPAPPPAIASIEAPPSPGIPSSVAPPRPVPADDFGLLSAAKKAVRQHDSARALSLLDEHERRFPSTPLGQERLHLRIEALCTGDRTAEAERLFAKLRQDTPDSPHIASLLRVCPSLSPN